ncbi:glycosyl transferase family group 2-domain-containing protein [Achaetomium macrosporum]|uniref:Glycosyl transferase family group 2-domain-containing protein n=1 Tax=Achaetomium macrosporum TaxID=79813 RepID=A0AAN7C0N8_9PEZI|nr:glycosyl transferase family group 2-domain-containing protein [Achaetomium macrosporum]
MDEEINIRQPPLAVVHNARFQEGRLSVGSTTTTAQLPTQTRILARYLYQKITEREWISPDRRGGSPHDHAAGIVLAADSGDYVSHPQNAFPELSAICQKLNIPVVFTMRCDTVDHFLDRLQDGEVEVSLQPHHIILPVVQSLHALATFDNSVRSRDCACFVREERLLLVWSRSTDDLLGHAGDVEDKLIGAMLGRNFTMPKTPKSFISQNPSSWQSQNSSANRLTGEKLRRGHDSVSTMGREQPAAKDSGMLKDSDFDIEDKEAQKVGPRPFILTQSIIVGLAFCLIIATTAGTVREVLMQVRMLGDIGYNRFAMLAMTPMSVAFCLFFFAIIVNALFQLLGPIKDIRQGNSRFFSSVKPQLKNHPDMKWPHITIQMPVYKEGLRGVIKPTVDSLLPAIAHYESLGGTASIVVAEDGFQILEPELADLRRKFYQQHGIGWIARPPHGQDGFVRGGRFKKASNLNYALDFTLRVEDELLQLRKRRAAELGCTEEELSADDDSECYDQALAAILEQDQGRTMAEGNVRIGDLILLVDSDTRVPVDCLSLAAMEFEESPEVAIIQHTSGVLKVTNTWFEDCIAYFTDIVYLSIRFAVGNGDCAPFVGHNAFLRWKAVQDVRFTAEDGRELFWSESHVSEDFDMALRLQTAGFSVRLATYDEGEFKEGVSLTIFDELLRWEKYAYGCSELMFHPIYYWPWKGPVTPMVWKIIKSRMQVTSKFTVFAYIFTYYAIAVSLPLTISMYFVIGWFQDQYQIVTFQPWKVFLGVILIFQIVSPICFAVYRHRLGNEVFWKALVNTWKWSPFFLIFFSGISWHLCYALIAHLFRLPIEWTSTAKELEATGFFISFNRVLKTFKWPMLFSVLMATAMVYLALFAPDGWIINFASGILPLATQVAGHMLLPILCLFH